LAAHSAESRSLNLVSTRVFTLGGGLTQSQVTIDILYYSPSFSTPTDFRVVVGSSKVAVIIIIIIIINVVGTAGSRLTEGGDETHFYNYLLIYTEPQHAGTASVKYNYRYDNKYCDAPISPSLHSCTFEEPRAKAEQVIHFFSTSQV